MFVAIATLKIEHYRRSPLVQGGLEIPCKVSVTIIGIVNNLLVLEKYLQLVEELYIEPKNEEILGSFLHVALEEPAPPPAKKKTKKSRKSSASNDNHPEQKDIRSFFGNYTRRRPTRNIPKKSSTEEIKKICID